MTRVCAVCGVKNSGKTTLIEKLIREYTARGVRTAVIKHDGHDFACDIPGTDSSRFYEAGAYGTAVFSDNRIFVHRQEIGRQPDRENGRRRRLQSSSLCSRMRISFWSRDSRIHLFPK